jgi:hypothetical protein
MKNQNVQILKNSQSLYIAKKKNFVVNNLRRSILYRTHTNTKK